MQFVTDESIAENAVAHLGKIVKAKLFCCNAKTTRHSHFQHVESTFFRALAFVPVLVSDAGAGTYLSAQVDTHRGRIQARRKQEADMTSGTAKCHAEPQRSRQP